MRRSIAVLFVVVGLMSGRSMATVEKRPPIETLRGVPAAPESEPSRAPEEQGVAVTYTLSWYTIDNGNTTSTDGLLVLTGTTGQADAASPSDGTFTVKGGFLSMSTEQAIFYDGFESGDLTQWSQIVGK